MARKTRTTRTIRATKLAPAIAAISQARVTMRHAVDRLVKRADAARNGTVDAVSQFEQVFEQRVSKAVARLGMPTAKDVQALSRQVAQLQASVDRLSRSRSRARA